MRCADASGDTPPGGAGKKDFPVRLRCAVSQSSILTSHTSPLTPQLPHFNAQPSRLIPRAIQFVFRIFFCSFRESVLLFLALVLHLGVAAFIVWVSLAPRPAAPKPRVIAESLVVTLAETESPTPTEAATPPPRPQMASPHPEAAPFLFDDASPVALAAPAVTTALAPIVSPTAPPPLPHRAPSADLPEITLPPAQALPARTSRAAAGATARLEHPRLISDPSHWLKRYPAEARRKHWEGTVVVWLEIAADGTLTKAEIHRTSGYDILDRAALRMLRTARFEGGPGSLLQPITYKLR